MILERTGGFQVVGQLSDEVPGKLLAFPHVGSPLVELFLYKEAI
jgi:hypothetical protein